MIYMLSLANEPEILKNISFFFADDTIMVSQNPKEIIQIIKCVIKWAQTNGMVNKLKSFPRQSQPPKLTKFLEKICK